MNRSEFMLKYAALQSKVAKIDAIQTADDFVEWILDCEKACGDVHMQLSSLRSKVSDYERCKNTLDGQRKKANAARVSFMYVEPPEVDTAPDDGGSNMEENEDAVEGGGSPGEAEG